ncbi:MAG: LptA/OstA family protein [candidate division WOR-3 bacterium]
MIPYKISSGTVEIIDRNQTIFKGGVEIYSDEIYIRAKEAFQTDTSLALIDSVFLKSKNFSMSSNVLNYKIPFKTIFGKGNIKIWREDTLKGDSLVFFKEEEKGILFGSLIYTSDTIEVKGERADFCKDSIIIKGKPEFKTPSITITADKTTYTLKDSTYKFISEVIFNHRDFYGRSGKLLYNINKNISTLINEPLIVKNKDSIMGEIITVDHKTNILRALYGKVATQTKEGKNIVWGDTINIYYNKETIDSVLVKGNPRGRFIKNDTTSGRSS